jgi:hypothetical protein
MNKSLVAYYSTAKVSTDLFNIGVINSTANTPGISLAILTTTTSTFKVYRAIKETPKIVCELTSDLAKARPGEVIRSAKFNRNTKFLYARSLDHVGISYSDKD